MTTNKKNNSKTYCDWCAKLIEKREKGYYFTVKDHHLKKTFDFCSDTCMKEFYTDCVNPDGN